MKRSVPVVPSRVPVVALTMPKNHPNEIKQITMASRAVYIVARSPIVGNAKAFMNHQIPKSGTSNECYYSARNFNLA